MTSGSLLFKNRWVGKIKMYDIAIIGAGIIGTSAARELSRYQFKIALLEKENDVACGGTKANSGIVHAGYDALFGTKKSLYNVRGNQLYDQVCQELSIPFKRVGSLVVAKSEEDLLTLERLKENGIRAKVQSLKIIGKQEAFELVPNLNHQVIGALYAPTAAIIDPWEAAIAYAENAVTNGVNLMLNYEVSNISKINDVFQITSVQGHTLKSRWIINASGLYGDHVYRMVNSALSFNISPKKGEYYLLDKAADSITNRIVFGCPSKDGKGVLAAPTTHGNVLIGPTSSLVSQKSDTKTTSEGLMTLRDKAKSLLHHIPYEMNITNYAGLRAEPSTLDFIVEASEIPNFINAVGIKSPGLSSAPAIAEEIVGIIERLNGPLIVNPLFNPIRRPRLIFSALSDGEKELLIKKNPLYGKIICRCEMITEGEIVDAIHRPVGATTVNGVKRRARPGSGRCQGGFCGPQVVSILARELDIRREKVTLEGVESYILKGRTKSAHGGGSLDES